MRLRQNAYGTLYRCVNSFAIVNYQYGKKGKKILHRNTLKLKLYFCNGEGKVLTFQLTFNQM